MNKANECTCPSGDGSLRWPCPKHPAVEQAGTNVGHGHVFPRADGVKMRCGGPGLCSECAADAYRARAALAQPSPASDLDPFNLAPHAEAFNEAPAEALKPEQAEAERPEVVAVMESNGAGGKRLAQRFPIVNVFVGDELMTVAQHERIAAQLHDALDESDGDRWKLRSERDAALARVAELEAKLSDPTAVHQWQFSNAWFDGSEEVVLKAGKEGSPIRTLYTAPPAQAQQLHDLDKQCRDDVARALGLRPSQERGFAWSYLLASIKSCVKASEDAAQAQHSVPEGVTIERDVAGTIHIKVGDFDFIQLQYQRPYTDNASTWKLAERIASLLAAAPGTEVPQAWLDVQAERRRQITAEGWTPDHDDLYCAAELPRAAAAYILSGANDEAPAIWPFSAKWWKPRDARANYMRAGALILAEIERLDRAAERGKEVGHE
ncbi:hypothetical protein V3478_31260 [Pseudomonas aeruginosa]|uniref:hypothetical protein n=1 Tax=Pseudomonas aeruginosa TaxID=287 RepID=UPI002F94679D